MLPELFSVAEWKALGESLGLTPRQLQVARLVCRGCGRSEIAHRLGVAPSTVRMHSVELFRRLDIHDRIGVPIRLILVHRRWKKRIEGSL